MRSNIVLKRAAIAVITAFSIANLFVAASRSNAEDESPAVPATTGPATDTPPGKKAPEPPKLPEPKGAKRLSKEYPIWVDPKQKAVIVEGQVALREGMLEMFACNRNTKEHELIIAANIKAYLVQMALL